VVLCRNGGGGRHIKKPPTGSCPAFFYKQNRAEQHYFCSQTSFIKFNYYNSIGISDI
jgi:hypothetical protein